MSEEEDKIEGSEQTEESVQPEEAQEQSAAQESAEGTDADTVDESAELSSESSEEQDSEGEAEAGDTDEIQAETDDGAVADGQPVVYNFAHPSHKLNSRLPVLEVINEKIAVMLAQNLSALFHQAIRVTQKPVAFMRFEEYVEGLPKSISISQFTTQPLQGSSLLVINGDLIYLLVDSFFGGLEQLGQEREGSVFTPTEVRIIERVRDKTFAAMAAGWDSVIRLNPEYSGFLSTTEMRTPARPADVVVVNSFEVALKTSAREIQIVTPYSVLEPVRPQLTNDLKTAHLHSTQWSQAFKQQLLDCELDIQGVFAESKISVKELMNLKVGDFIPLGKVQTVEFSSEGIPLFEASVGISNGMVSASVNTWYERKNVIAK